MSAPLRVYRLDVTYPEGSRDPGWEPPGWDGGDDLSGDGEFRWPRVHPYLSKNGARARAKLLEKYGAKVAIVTSEPVQWPGEPGTARSLHHQRDLLADALSGLLVRLGVVEDVSLTGPELYAAGMAAAYRNGGGAGR